MISHKNRLTKEDVIFALLVGSFIFLAVFSVFFLIGQLDRGSQILLFAIFAPLLWPVLGLLLWPGVIGGMLWMAPRKGSVRFCKRVLPVHYFCALIFLVATRDQGLRIFVQYNGYDALFAYLAAYAAGQGVIWYVAFWLDRNFSSLPSGRKSSASFDN